MFFTLSRDAVNKFFPINNSFEDDFFSRFEGAVLGKPFTYLFDIDTIRSQYDTFDAWTEAVLQKVSDAKTVSFADAAQRYIVATVFESAIPSLDLVISKGGLLVTNGQGIAPASVQRVERLLKNVTQQRQQAFEILYVLLGQEGLRTAFREVGGCRVAEWQTTLIRNPYDVVLIGGTYFDFFNRHDLLKRAQEEITKLGVPPALILRCVKMARNLSQYTPVEREIYSRCETLMFVFLQELFYLHHVSERTTAPQEGESIRLLNELKDSLLCHIEQFPEYDTTDDPLNIFKTKRRAPLRNFIA